MDELHTSLQLYRLKTCSNTPVELDVTSNVQVRTIKGDDMCFYCKWGYVCPKPVMVIAHSVTFLVELHQFAS